MFSVLIVDDEKWICELIERSVRWDEFGMTVAGIAQNGMEAMRILRSRPMDIVITDIRMPGMDGLDLIRTAQSEGICPAFIIISGYQDFEYARIAMQYHVRNYLLKPVDEDELAMTLIKVLDEIISNNSDRDEHAEDRKLLQEKTNCLQEQFVRMMVRESSAQIDIQSLPGLIGAGAYACVLFRLRLMKPFAEEYSDFVQKRENLRKTVEGTFSKRFRKYVLFTDSNYVCAVVGDTGTEDSFPGYIRNVIEETQIDTGENGGYSVSVSIGSVVSDINSIPASFRDADNSSKYSLISETQSVIMADGLGAVRADRGNILSNRERIEFINAYNSENDQAIEDATAAIFQQIGRGADAAQYYQVAKELIGIIDSNCVSIGKTAEKIEQEIEWFGAVDLLRQYVVSTIIDARNKAKEDADKGRSAYVQTACQYIKNNFEKDITLNEVAKEVYLNPAYFSMLFKKETGLGFTDYLQEYRMERAKELLNYTTRKVASIAAEVGYSDVRYFNRLFKKKIGLTPSEYRRLIQKRSVT